MNWTDEVLNRLMWASLQGMVFVAAVVLLCRWQSLGSGPKVWICRAAWVKLPLGLLVGIGLAAPTANHIGDLASGGSGWHGWLAVYLLTLWTVGVLIELWLAFRALGHSRALIATAVPADAAAMSQVSRLSFRVGLRSAPQVLSHGALSEPCVSSGAVLVPQGFSPETDPLAAAHELAHLKHRDLFWMGIAAIVQSVFWFLPGIAALKRETVLWQEAEADALARLTLGASPEEMARRVLVAAARPAFGLSFGAAETERRIKALLEARTSRIALFGACALALAAAIPIRLEMADPEEAVSRSPIHEGPVLAAPVSGMAEPTSARRFAAGG